MAAFHTLNPATELSCTNGSMDREHANRAALESIRTLVGGAHDFALNVDRTEVRVRVTKRSAAAPPTTPLGIADSVLWPEEVRATKTHTPAKDLEFTFRGRGR